MFSFTAILTAASATLVSAGALPRRGASSASITPRAEYSSSIDVIGCKIDTNRVAYWPDLVGCDDICIEVFNQGRSLYLLRIDTSGGDYGISNDAWNYLTNGESATEGPHESGGVDMNYEVVSVSKCESLMTDGKLPLSAANSMNYLTSCLSQPESWVARNHNLYNINDPACKSGVDEICHLDLAISNQPVCASGPGIAAVLNGNVVNKY
ncbi:hypothetical protein FOPG_19294 [Fusarium oxysporum f. sp. conglutinans race 2 54008]|uniref:Cerato-platanin n=3 Tax=Fusarium oxysporum f. sp. conglutinans TaxID=100902 RepID=A0A8H6GZP4_FUSOX|nr:hypothetical protein FOXB_15947 [Fusarium oxysporum f. sp. conglutinans Fo5176]EXL64442.1 hypothetical protein FOPG_19294 [Fusarium oxysporum f. sp. conglutinans race 2 54008]KAF6527697.1 hypothetical protein HZS61_007999 [Fusarium oxysporum f. sp. conglutinans]KAG7001275.1 hypothetical protein FocnCong_v013302 [Fusarium oxysporum f. sp. conglutinans]KAI8417212.1 hypothetical protein FOFC_03525 [Fusarium oxysporum]